MSKIQGKAKRYDGTAVDYVLLFDWVTGNCIGKSVPDAAGNWTYNHATNLNCGITYVADGCAPITHGSYFFESVADTTINNIGVQGTANFGVGVTDALPVGMIEIEGTRLPEHLNYGNYQYSDGSVMVWIPMFYYRWGSIDSLHATKYDLNSLDVKSKHDFAGVEAANVAGYAVHRAFYDDGKLKDGFFVDKYQCSNNAGVASSLKNGISLSTSASNNPIGNLTGAPTNDLAGTLKAAKSRGTDFFVTTIFIQRALSLLSMAHAQAATSTAACAWYEATGVNNFPKGNNNNALGDVNDTSVLYAGTGYLNAGRTGSANPFAKTTHNGQASGVADLNGNMWEAAIGLTQTSGNFYVLKTSAKASALTGGTTLATDAWGMTAMTQSYDSLGATSGELKGVTGAKYTGSTSTQVFSSALSGLAWQASGAGIVQVGGANGTGNNVFGNDFFYDDRTEALCPLVGGAWNDSTAAGVWAVYYGPARTTSNSDIGVRAALYFV